MMKAAVVQSPGKLEVLDIPIPRPGPYDALCRLCFGATCAGTDLRLMDGGHPRPVSFPTVLGHESVGRVVEVGAKVRHLRPGDLITRVGCPADPAAGLGSNWGGFAEYGIARDHWQMKRDGVPRDQWERYRVNQILHPAIAERDAPMLITWRETLSYSKRLGVSPGSRLLLVGSGANALAFAAHACNLGASVVVVGSPGRADRFRCLPVAAYYDYHEERLAEAIRSGSHGAPFDVLLDAVGDSATANRLLPLLRRGAAVGVYGWNDRANYGLNPFSANGSFSVYGDGYDEEEADAEIQSMILSGLLWAELWYDPQRPVPLARIAGAYDSLRRHQALKYLIAL